MTMLGDDVWVGGPVKLDVLGILLEQWSCLSASAEFCVGPDWATLYSIQSGQPGKGHASRLLIEAKRHYELTGKQFGSSIALNERMRAILRRLDIKEYRG